MKPELELYRHRIFVYGTLKPGGRYHRRYLQGRKHSALPGYVRGRLYTLRDGYPAMTEGDDWIKGCLIAFDDDRILQDLDKLEEYYPDHPRHESFYYRAEVPCFDCDKRELMPAWVYLMDPATVRTEQGVYLPKGTWEEPPD